MKSYLERVAMAATDSERETILLTGANFFSASISKAIFCNRVDAPLVYAVLKQYEEELLKNMDPQGVALAKNLKDAMGAITIST